MNINPIANGLNFSGRVFWAGSTETLARATEKNTINQYAKVNDCDVVVLDRDYYINDKGKYSTVIVREDEVTGHNQLYTKIFDFQYPTDKAEREFFIFNNGDIHNLN